jgi:hypothetical protein
MQRWCWACSRSSSVQPSRGATATPNTRALQRGDIPQIVVFDNDSLLRAHIYFFSNTPALGKWGNSISSMVILAGRWEFFDEEKFQGTRVGLCSPWADDVLTDFVSLAEAAARQRGADRA